MAVFAQVYGMTETTGSITQLDDHVPALLRSCGRPYPWVQVRIVKDDGTDAAPGIVGELWTGSDQNMIGYRNNPDATAATLTADGWLRTGDAGNVDADGYVYLREDVRAHPDHRPTMHRRVRRRATALPGRPGCE